MLSRTTFSILALAGLAAPAVAQMSPYGNSYVPPPIVSPWPGTALRTYAAPTPAPITLPANPDPEPRTIYYRKETNRPWVRQAAAVELVPLKVVKQQPPPMNGTQAQPKSTETVEIDPRLPGSNGIPPLFRLEGENDLVARENAERQKRKLEPIVFPEHAPTSKTPFVARALAPSQTVVEPNYVVYRRLFFEDKNSERYGWSMGPLQPLTDLGTFLGNFSNLPYNFFSFPGLWFDSNAGLCLPGDPVPYLLYPPGFSVSGFAGQAAVTVALYAIFP